jgi:hypothetical protein
LLVKINECIYHFFFVKMFYVTLIWLKR